MNFEDLFADLFELEQLVHQTDDHALFRARDRVLQRLVSLRIHLQPETGSRLWYERETDVLASLDHPSIRHIYMAGYRGEVAWRAGKWIEGESLAEACARGPRPVPMVLSIARDLLYAMDHAHVRGIVMRRVRPNTLMIDTAQRAVVTDLRYSNRVLDLVPEDERGGSDPFLAPEIRRGELGDPWADIFAAGALLYFALTGQPPAKDPLPLRELNPRAPMVMERWLMRALERKPQDRYPSAAEMLQALAEWTDPFTEPGATGPVVIMPDSPQWERRLRRALGDDYELLSEVGAGSFGRVYRVRDLHLEREVALKVLDPRISQDPVVAEGFQREAQIAASLTHPNIVRILDIDGRLGLLWYTMELIRGQSVAQLIEQSGRLSVHRAIEILDDTISALEYAHERRVVHRDIKPENLLVDPNGLVHVTDFGLALALPRARLFGGATSRSGTPQFAAPEQLAGGQVDRRTDLFSLGAVGYFLLLGRPPFPERGPEHQWKGAVEFTLPDLATERPDVPPLLVEALERACAFDPSKRFPDGLAFREAIDAAGFITGERRLPKASLFARLRDAFTG